MSATAGPSRRRRSGRIAPVLVALLLLAGSTACSGGSDEGASADMAAAQAARRGAQGRVPQFLTECKFSHFAPDDPIVWPDEPGKSHDHTFIGNNSADAFSTVETLARGTTNCKNQLDLASYWAPTLYDRRQPVKPTKADAYYRPGPLVDPTTIEAFPYGLKIVAGDHMATHQSTEVVRWSCGVGGTLESTAPQCRNGVPLRLEVVFPDCWDGTSTDSKDHRSHMARSAEGKCPDTHPVPVPQLTLALEYPISGPGHELLLASGTTDTAHADFLNAWDEATLEGEITACLHRGVICGVASNRPQG